MSTALILELTIIGVAAVSFLASLIWCRRAADHLVARRRLLTIAMCGLVLAVVGMAFTKPNPGLLAFIIVIAIGERERRRLSRQISQTQTKNDA